MPTESFIPGKDASLESSIATLQGKLDALGFHVEQRSWLNPVDRVWSVHVRDRDCALLFTNGKGGSRLAALASALGEFFERLSCNYFWAHYYRGDQFARRDFAHYPREQWFQPGPNGEWPEQLLSPELRRLYNPDGSVDANTLVDLNAGDAERGICALPYVRIRDGATVWFPVNIIGNLYVINGIAAGIHGLREAGFGILVKDASLGGEYPVMNVTLLHPQDQGCFSSFGAHPRFEIALERALTELLQGRGLDALAGFPPPGFDLDEIAASPNIEIQSSTPAASSAGTSSAPGMSEIYPLDELEWENNSVGNPIREAILHLPDLDEEECADLLDTLNELDLPDQRPITTLIGLAAEADSFWADLRVGELKTILALACGDDEAIREGCE